ncbi:isoleucyl-tRNA synthetase [Pedobacter sp. L105]|uniref:isoleucyl-tRNA synthetase n=1 Tax=Pedobacter sp. L105 TaxID=1641871 RepID=UPI00131E336F|nr:isoleucyl-tRNA synthetase [Pedobacter sp. L105]
MIKVLKLQKALLSIILGVIALVVYIIMSEKKMHDSKYVLEASGLLLMLGGLLFLYPILFSRKDKEGCIELDPEVPIEERAEVEN